MNCKISGRHEVLLGIGARRTNKEISDFLSISRRMAEKVRKELEDSRFDCKSTSERKTHDQRSNPIRMLEFLAEVWEIIDNELSKSMCATARDKGMDEKLIMLVVHEDISYVSYMMRKG